MILLIGLTLSSQTVSSESTQKYTRKEQEAKPPPHFSMASLASQTIHLSIDPILFYFILFLCLYVERVCLQKRWQSAPLTRESWSVWALCVVRLFVYAICLCACVCLSEWPLLTLTLSILFLARIR